MIVTIVNGHVVLTKDATDEGGLGEIAETTEQPKSLSSLEGELRAAQKSGDAASILSLALAQLSECIADAKKEMEKLEQFAYAVLSAIASPIARGIAEKEIEQLIAEVKESTKTALELLQVGSGMNGSEADLENFASIAITVSENSNKIKQSIQQLEKNLQKLFIHIAHPLTLDGLQRMLLGMLDSGDKANQITVS